MGGAPVVVTLRPGVQFTADAAASFRRAEAELGRPIRCNSTYRDYWHQMSMYNAWNAWVQGRGPRPNHSRAIHPDYSVHCRGRALDTPDWTVPGFIALMARHGWIRTAAGDPTEQHHFEYQWWRDLHFGQPAGGGSQPIEEDIMASREEVRADMSALLDAKLAPLLARIELATASTQFFKHEHHNLWIWLLEDGDFIRIRDLTTARLYKERNGGRQARVLSKTAIQLLVSDLTLAGGRDLSAVGGAGGEVRPTTAEEAEADAMEVAG